MMSYCFWQLKIKLVCAFNIFSFLTDKNLNHNLKAESMKSNKARPQARLHTERHVSSVPQSCLPRRHITVTNAEPSWSWDWEPSEQLLQHPCVTSLAETGSGRRVDASWPRRKNKTCRPPNTVGGTSKHFGSQLDFKTWAWQLVTCQQVPLTSCQNIYQHSSAGRWWFPITPGPFDCLIEEVELLSLAAGLVWENSLGAGRARRHVEAGPGREDESSELTQTAAE